MGPFSSTQNYPGKGLARDGLVFCIFMEVFMVEAAEEIRSPLARVETEVLRWMEMKMLEVV